MPLTATNRALQKRSLLMKFVLLVIISSMLAWLAYRLTYINKVDELKNVQDQKLFITTSLLSRELGSLGDLVQLLASSQILSHQAINRSQIQDLSPSTLQQLQNDFIRFGLASPKIAQLRWLDKNGDELVRVDFSSDQATVIQQNQLQNKQSRYYFQQGMKVLTPNVYFSPIDLNVEHQHVVQPYEPTIRASIKTSSVTHFIEGLLIINYRLSNVFAAIRGHSNTAAQINIVNHNGYWLLNQQADKEWGFMLGQEQMTLINESPELWRYQMYHPRGGDIIINQQLNSFVTLATFDSIGSAAETNQLLLYVTSDRQFLALGFIQSLLLAVAIFAVLTSSGLVIMWRGYRYQLRLVELSLKLSNEQQELKRVNDSLIENMSRQQLLQDELVEANKLSALGLMVAGVAHELNTPIGGALISVSNADNANDKLKIAMQEGLSKTQFSDGVNMINSSLHLAKINLDKAVNHIKQFKRLAIDRVNEDYLDCELDLIVSDLVVSLRPLVKKTKVTIVEDIEKNLTLVSRPGIISQVLENLLSNSLNHGFIAGQAGTIEIKARRLDDHQICITVSDNGSGIPEEIQAHIFDPFVTSGRGKGNIGLGLYMVNQWVTKLLDGTLNFVSQPDIDGQFATQFTLIIPFNVKASAPE